MIMSDVEVDSRILYHNIISRQKLYQIGILSMSYGRSVSLSTKIDNIVL